VTIDEKSLDSIGQWPWPRQRFGELVRSTQSADVIGIDVNFFEPSRYGRDDDTDFAEALSASKVPVVLTAELTDDGVKKPLDQLAGNVKLGFGNITVDADGVVRRAFNKQNGLRSFDYQIQHSYSNRDAHETKTSNQQPVRINYYDNDGAYPRVSFVDIINGNVPEQLIDDSIIIVGATARGLSPNYNTPLGTMRPPQLRANMTNMFIAGDYLTVMSAFNAGLVVLFSLVGVMIAAWSRRFWVMITEAFSLAGMYFGITLVIFEFNVLLDIFYPLLSLFGAVVVMAMYEYFVVRQREEVLEESYQTLSTLIQNLTEGVILLDTNDTIVASNSVARKAVTSSGDISFGVLQHVLSRHFEFDAVYSKVRKNNEKRSIRDVKLADDTYYQLIISSVEPGQSDVLSDGGVIIVFHDMTQQKELARVREDFTSMMVHELRSPLDAVKKMSNHLNERDVAQEKKEKYLSLISNNASQVLTLVNDLLDVSKIEAGKFELRKESTDIEKLISERVDFYEPLSEERELSWEVAEDVPETVTLDPDRINQVMNNILSNAIKFTDETEGEVSVHVIARQPQELQEVDSKEVHWFDTGEAEVTNTDYVIIDIGDNGAGIPEEDINELFDKFKQFEAAAKTEKAGTGLGLAIVKGIIQQHDGIIGVASQAGEGTHFLVALPTDSD
jgi:signal transduction histidine kinase